MGVATGLQGNDVGSEMFPSVVWAIPERVAIHCLSDRDENSTAGQEREARGGVGRVGGVGGGRGGVSLSQREMARQRSTSEGCPWPLY